MAKLSGVEIIIIIGVGFAVFVILFIVAHRQIARFKIRDLLSRPLLRQSQFGASPSFTAQIQRNIADMDDLDVQPQMWDDSWTKFFRTKTDPNYIHRAKALDFAVLLKLELRNFGAQFDWSAFEDLGDYFDRWKSEFPVDRIPPQTIAEFVKLYRYARFSEAPFAEKEHEGMVKLTMDMLKILDATRNVRPKVDSLISFPVDFERKDSVKLKDPKEKNAPKKFPKGYEPLDSDLDGSTAGSVLGSKPLAKLRRVGQRKAKLMKNSDAAWEEHVPLHVFHDNPLITFDSAPSTSRSQDKMFGKLQPDVARELV